MLLIHFYSHVFTGQYCHVLIVLKVSAVELSSFQASKLQLQSVRQHSGPLKASVVLSASTSIQFNSIQNNFICPPKEIQRDLSDDLRDVLVFQVHGPDPGCMHSSMRTPMCPPVHCSLLSYYDTWAAHGPQQANSKQNRMFKKNLSALSLTAKVHNWGLRRNAACSSLWNITYSWHRHGRLGSWQTSPVHNKVQQRLKLWITLLILNGFDSFQRFIVPDYVVCSFFLLTRHHVTVQMCFTVSISNITVNNAIVLAA